MVAIMNLAVVAFAAVVAAQAGNQISDGQIQIQTSPIKLSTPVPSVTPVSVTPVSVTPVSVTPVSVTPISVTPVSVTPVSVTPVSVTPVSVTPSVTPVVSVTPGTTLAVSTRVSASVSIRPTANGTFTGGAPSATVPPFKGAANAMSWGKEIAVAAVGVAVGLALL